MFFPLINICTIQAETSTSDRSGQEKKSWSDSSTVACLWHPVSGSEVTNVRDEFDEVGTLYTDSFSGIKIGQRVINIKDSYGNVVESGPFEVMNVKTLFTLTGKRHHLSSKLRGKRSSQ